MKSKSTKKAKQTKQGRKCRKEGSTMRKREVGGRREGYTNATTKAACNTKTRKRETTTTTSTIEAVSELDSRDGF